MFLVWAGNIAIKEPLYIACLVCKEAVCTGKRCAYAFLAMPGIAPVDGGADAAANLSANDYWCVPEGEDWRWQRHLLPHVRTFLSEHAGHPLRSEFNNHIGMPLFQGERFRTKQPIEVMCGTDWDAHRSERGHDVPLPANEVFVVSHDLVPGASG
jgi:hypothetical protein